MSPTFQKIEAISKKSRIVTLLREAIISGNLERGEQIVEAKLAQQFGVGQGLIREALIELEHQGFVQRTPFAGTKVVILTREDIKQIFEIRKELEPLAFYLAATNAGENDLAELNEFARKTKSAIVSKDFDAFFETHLNFRRKIWQVSGNRYLRLELERIVIPLYALYLSRSSFNPDGLALCVELEEKTMDAFRRNDTEQAREIAQDFLVRMREYLGTRLDLESDTK